MSNLITLKRYDKQGNEMFTKGYPKNMADALLKSHSNYPSGEKQWELVVEAPKRGRKAKDDEEIDD